MLRFQLWISLGLLTALGCADSRVTGPEARALYVRYRDHGVSAKGFTIYLNGRVVSEDEVMKLIPDSIESLEVIKGAGIVRVFTRGARRDSLRVGSK